MKKTIAISVTLFLLVPVLILAAYNDVVLSGTTLQLTIGDSAVDFTVNNGSVENLSVESGSIVFDLAGNSSINIKSSDKKDFSFPTGLIHTFECGTSESTLAISRTASQSTITGVRVTPQSATCVATGSGGSGGGSGTGGATSGTTATTETTTTAAQETVSASAATTVTTPSAGTVAVAPQTAVTPSVTTPQVITQAQAISPVFSAGLKKGTENSDVERLQKLLATDSEIYPEGKITGYYGSLTEKAVQRFQMKYEVVSSASDPGYGYLGPKTRAKIEEVFSGVVTETVPSPSVEVTVSVTLSRELDPGMSGSDVKALQEFLNSDTDTRIAGSGVGSPGNETEYYGTLTAEAVKKFQAKYGISTVGRVGPQTLQKLNELMSASAPQSSVQTPSGISESVSEPQDTSVLQAQLLQAAQRLQELQQQLQSLRGQ